MAAYRTERDFLGAVKVPSDAYYGAETQRAIDNFPISRLKVPLSLIRAYAIVKLSAARANIKERKLDASTGNAIITACKDVMAGKLSEQFVLDVFQAGAGTSTNMNLNEVIANRAIVILGGKKGNYKLVHPNDHVNMSQSTNDTYHAAMHIAIYTEISNALLPALRKLEGALWRKSAQFSKIVKIGRTHLQDAVPMTLGQEFSGYASSVSSSAEHIKTTAQSLLYVSLGGTAVGTGIGSKTSYPRDVTSEISRITGFRFKMTDNFFSMQQNQNEEKWVSSSLCDLSIALNKIANDFRLMASGPAAGFGDIILPAVQPGSSIMPGKVNPSMPEMLNMVCFDVMGRNHAIENAANNGQLELNVYMPIISYNLLYSIEVLANAINAFTAKCVSGMRANTDRISSNLEKDVSIATALSPYIGYAKAAEIAKMAQREGKTVKEVCLELGLMPKEELETILDPARMVKPSD